VRRIALRLQAPAQRIFPDGSELTSADVKASYERIVHPPPGVISKREVDYAAISGVDTPNARSAPFCSRHSVSVLR
jgi:hypothetical protein